MHTERIRSLRVARDAGQSEPDFERGGRQRGPQAHVHGAAKGAVHPAPRRVAMQSGVTTKISDGVIASFCVRRHSAQERHDENTLSVLTYVRGDRVTNVASTGVVLRSLSISLFILFSKQRTTRIDLYSSLVRPGLVPFWRRRIRYTKC